MTIVENCTMRFNATTGKSLSVTPDVKLTLSPAKVCLKLPVFFLLVNSPLVSAEINFSIVSCRISSCAGVVDTC